MYLYIGRDQRPIYFFYPLSLIECRPPVPTFYRWPLPQCIIRDVHEQTFHRHFFLVKYNEPDLLRFRGKNLLCQCDIESRKKENQISFSSHNIIVLQSKWKTNFLELGGRKMKPRNPRFIRSGYQVEFQIAFWVQSLSQSMNHMDANFDLLYCDLVENP